MSVLNGVTEIGKSAISYGKENQSFLKDTISNGFKTAGNVLGDLLTLNPIGAVKDYATGAVNQGERAVGHAQTQLHNVFGGVLGN